MIIDGRALAQQRKAELLERRAQFGPLALALISSDSTAVTQSYIKIKARIAAEIGVDIVRCTTFEQAQMCDGIILQLPLPSGMDVDSERNKIPVNKDVDILSDSAYAKFVAGEYPPPPVARAINYMLTQHGIEAQGARVVVVGQGRLVGMPAADMLRSMGAFVHVLTRGDDVAAHTKDADIIVLGAGSPHMLKPDMIKAGVAIFDAGTSESNGVVVGDADPQCADVAGFITPVPGGVGPLAVVEIFGNLFDLLP